MERENVFLRGLGKIWPSVLKDAQKAAQKISPKGSELDMVVAENVLLYRALYSMFTENSILPPIADKQQAIKIGYQQNPDFYSVVDKATNLYASVPWKIIKIGKDGKSDDYFDQRIWDILESPNQDTCQREFENLGYMYYLALGDWMTYAPRYENGNNAGQLTDSGMYVMPTQYVWIYSGGWREPVKEYVINFNAGNLYRMPARDVIHMKMSNPEFINGNNFYGQSPIIVASDIIRMQLAGYAIAKASYQRGWPAGLLTREDPSDSETDNQEQVQNISSTWRQRFGTPDKTGNPLVTMGKWNWQEMGFKSLKDLDVLEFMKHGTKRLSDMLSIPYVDKDSKYSNMNEVRKATFTNRIMPDKEMYAQKMNAKLFKYYGEGIRVVPDWSKVPELQDEKLTMSTILKDAVSLGAKTPNDYNRAMGLEVSDDPACDIYYISNNYQRLDDVALGQVMPEDSSQVKPNG